MVLQPWFMLGKPSTTGLHPQPSTTSAPLLFQYCRPQGSIQAPPPYLLSQGLPLAWTCVVRLETHLLLPSLGWDLKHTAPCPGFYTSSWTQTWVLVLWRQSLYQQSHPGILRLFGCWCLVSCFVFELRLLPMSSLMILPVLVSFPLPPCFSSVPRHPRPSTSCFPPHCISIWL